MTTTRTALVTGASRGIGLEIARRLADEGYALTLAARREPGLLDAAAALREAGAEAHPVVANLGREQDVDRLAAEHTERFGALDLLVLNGGVGAEGTVAELPLKTYDLVLNVNLRAQFQLIQQTLPLLRKSAAATPARGAKVVALSSITGVAGEAGLSAYGASKAGLISLCETLTLEESASGVTATALCPGYVDTDMTTFKRDSLGRDAMLTTRDVAELVLSVSRLSAHAVVPSIVLTRAGEQIWRA
ncbi:SDR family oxidoreductase [Amycolatopsis sp. K13G38]|uniref:SDR family oxidoreductase n=1 Tax=Amycolatopsis acididurans TaxID=2724524 RepID=A0ABX1J4H9_9PSEU|nr:SDR family oxidoreductase [Amycolatopsis acididurans]NKQ53225.1 SDR family oxidoreductase [Amycolatopsis acididurans]